jgi:hypothetical protein
MYYICVLNDNKMRKEKIDLNLVTIHTNSFVKVDSRDDIDDDTDDNEFIQFIDGQIKMYDLDSPSDEDKDDIIIGEFSLKLLWGTEQMIYESLDNHSMNTATYSNELFDDDMNVKDEYYDLMCEIYENRFLIISEISIKEEYRGQGIVKKLIDTINITYRCPMVLIPFPLQYQPTNDNKEELKLLPPISGPMRKVVNSYKKCGFKKPKRNSLLMVKW